MQISIIVRYLKIFWLFAVAVIAVWFFKDYQHQKDENIRQTENIRQQRISDSTKFASQILSKDEINEYLAYQNSDLKKKLSEAGINENRIKSIISQTFKYRDTTKKESDVSGLVEAIKNSIPKVQAWSDTTKCQKTSGLVSFDGEKLKVIVNDRQFENKSDGVAYWERRQWSFLGIKTRFLGKKVFTAKTFDECGETRLLKIEKKE